MKTGLRVIAVLLLALAAGSAGRAEAQEPADPAIRGLRVLATQGYDAGLAVWTETWTDAEDAAKRQTLSEAFGRLVGFAGPPIGFDMICVIPLSTRLKRIYVVLLHRQQPAFLHLTMYRPVDAWIVTNIAFDTDPANVIPGALLDTADRRGCS